MIKKMNLKNIIIASFLIALSFIGFSQKVSADEESDSINERCLTNTNSVVVNDHLLQESNPEVMITNEILKPVNGSFALLHATVWMVVKDNNGVPALDKYWYVTYQGGTKYQGYVYWTGNRQIEELVPTIRWNFQFSGYLSPA